MNFKRDSFVSENKNHLGFYRNWINSFDISLLAELCNK